MLQNFQHTTVFARSIFIPELQDSSSFGYILLHTQASAGAVAVPLQNQPNPIHISVLLAASSKTPRKV